MTQPAWVHTYLSTACLHATMDNNPGLHAYCGSAYRPDGTAKEPATCKFCEPPPGVADAPGRCICDCHRPDDRKAVS